MTGLSSRYKLDEWASRRIGDNECAYVRGRQNGLTYQPKRKARQNNPINRLKACQFETSNATIIPPKP